jgi:hypothetical protein
MPIFLATRILRWIVYFWRICAPLPSETLISWLPWIRIRWIWDVPEIQHDNKHNSGSMNSSRADSHVNCLKTFDVSETHSVSNLRERDLFPWGWRLSVSLKRRRFLNNWHGYQPEKSSYSFVAVKAWRHITMAVERRPSAGKETFFVSLLYLTIRLLWFSSLNTKQWVQLPPNSVKKGSRDTYFCPIALF